jgi:hypothetical protein
MSHPLILGLFDDPAAAAAAARELRAMGVPRERVSIVARSHQEEGSLAEAAGASPGSEIEDSRTASRLAELSAHLIAAVALILPGIGPIVADGPLAAELGEAAGHAAGGIGRALQRAGLSAGEAEQWEARIDHGAVLVGAHLSPENGSGDVTAAPGDVSAAHERLRQLGATALANGTWPAQGP